MEIYIGWPQMFMLFFSGLTLVAGILVHGKPREGNYHAGYVLLLWLILLPVMLWGGFFTK